LILIVNLQDTYKDMYKGICTACEYMYVYTQIAYTTASIIESVIIYKNLAVNN